MIAARSAAPTAGSSSHCPREGGAAGSPRGRVAASQSRRASGLDLRRLVRTKRKRTSRARPARRAIAVATPSRPPRESATSRPAPFSMRSRIGPAAKRQARERALAPRRRGESPRELREDLRRGLERRLRAARATSGRANREAAPRRRRSARRRRSPPEALRGSKRRQSAARPGPTTGPPIPSSRRHAALDSAGEAVRPPATRRASGTAPTGRARAARAARAALCPARYRAPGPPSFTAPAGPPGGG